jgi:transposase
MSLAGLEITAVTVEGRSKSEVARDYGVSRVWVQKLVHRSSTTDTSESSLHAVRFSPRWQSGLKPPPGRLRIAPTEPAGHSP